ncbi:hypothetical protein [Endozoicomonas sp. 8E]|uniref:hypothetical protein n=1 Tax=Endozoicomonas sp. 8E TaxID=3035692 RepID=UPI002938FCA7|nr:hypothetical protein [Endozoicomonas sp. 8E]WOG26954.1 hypothetical protein P6910_20750 [Endozoicomonas sp. 8E]
MAALLLSLSVISQAKTLTRHFIVKLEQNADFPNLNFFIRPDWPASSSKASDIADTNGYPVHDLPSDNKRHRTDSYEVKTPLIDSISWQWFYTTTLMVACELILTTKDFLPVSKRYSSLPPEAVIAFGWLLKSYWNRVSTLFKPIEQQKTGQSHPFAIITMIPASEHPSPQYQSLQPSRQPAQEASIQRTGSFTSPLRSDSGEGNEDPQPHRHTLDLNCFVYPCHGICRLRPSSDNAHSFSAGAAHTDPRQPLNDDVIRHEHLPVDDLIIINGLLNLGNHKLVEKTGISSTLPCLPSPTAPGKAISTTSNDYTSQTGTLEWAEASHSQQAGSKQKGKNHTGYQTCLETVVGREGLQQPCGKSCKTAKSLSSHKSRYHSGQKTCYVPISGKDCQQWPCGKVCKNAQNLIDHKRREHTGQQTCTITVVGEYGQQWPCGRICKNAQTLMDHKRRHHTEQKTCDMTVVGEGGLQRRCGRLCKNSKDLSDHKRRYHTGQQVCFEKVPAENGQLRPCGMVYKNAQSLATHRSQYHTGQQTCRATVVAEDGQSWPCARVFKNAQALAHHKYREHSGQKACVVKVEGKDGQQRICGKVCKNAGALQDHKSRYHSGQKICDVTVVGVDGQQRPCERVCKSSKDLAYHKKRLHRKRKPVDVDQDNSP